jgi:NAD(P)-dependent dehydrogenase (short-subunit alcohol dehydrogenase family)
MNGQHFIGIKFNRRVMKKIIVTGSASGFGLQTVQILAKKGHTVYATMRNINTKNAEVARGLKTWAKANDADIRIIELDVTSVTSVKKAMTQIIQDGGQIDVLINNAGLLIWGLSETLSTKQLEQIFQVNVFGADRMNKAVLPYMRLQNSGLLIQLSSGLSRLHLPYLGAYSATKAAIDTLAETLHYELRETGIDSIIIQPGAYPSTDLFTKLIPADTPSVANNYGEFGSKIKQGIRTMFTHTQQSREPIEVAHLIAEIIDSPREKRKLWTAIGIESGQPFVEAINESTYQFSQRVQNALGIYS